MLVLVVEMEVENRWDVEVGLEKDGEVGGDEDERLRWESGGRAMRIYSFFGLVFGCTGILYLGRGPRDQRKGKENKSVVGRWMNE